MSVWKTDTRRGWLAAICGFFLHIVMGGQRRAIGLIFVEIADLLALSNKEASAVVSAFYITSLAASPFAALLVRCCAARLVISAGVLLVSGAFFVSAFLTQLSLLVLTLGFFSGLGSAFIHAPALVLIGQHFERRRALAVGVCLSGGAVGAFCFPPLLGFSAERFGFPGAMMTLAAASLQALVFAVLMLPPERLKPKEEQLLKVEAGGVTEAAVTSQGKVLEAEQSRAPEEEEQRTDLIAGHNGVEQHEAVITNPSKALEAEGNGALPTDQPKPASPAALLRSPAFVLFASSGALATELLPMSFLLLPALSEDLNIPLQSQTLLLLLMGVPDLVARLAGGWLADRLASCRCDLFCLLVSLQAVAWLAVTACPTLAGLAAFSQAMGLTGGAIFTLYVPLLVDAVGIENLSSILSASLLLEGGVCLTLPLALAALRDASGSWVGAFHVMAAMAAVAVLLVIGFCRSMRLCCRKC